MRSILGAMQVSEGSFDQADNMKTVKGQRRIGKALTTCFDKCRRHIQGHRCDLLRLIHALGNSHQRLGRFTVFNGKNGCCFHVHRHGDVIVSFMAIRFINTNARRCFNTIADKFVICTLRIGIKDGLYTMRV